MRFFVRDEKRSAKKALLIVMSIMALVVQPMYGLVASQIVKAAAYGDVIVRQSENPWSASNTSGGASSYVSDTTAPYGNGALQMTTPSGNNASKAIRTKALSPNVNLSDIAELSYWTKQVTANNPTQTISLQLTVNGLTGTSSSTTLVFEPYWNVAGHAGTSQNLPNGVWQQWNVKNSVFWSTKTYATAGLVNGAGGPPFYTLAQVIANNPNAKVTSIIVNIGTYNPGNVSLTDGVSLNGVVYDFEPAIVAPLAPTIDIPTEGQVITSSADVTVSWNKPANAETFEYTFDGGATHVSTGATQSFMQTLANGTYQVQVRAIGSTGLISSWSAVRNFTVDVDEAPLATIITPAENSYVRTKANGNKLQITGKYTDDRSVNYLTLQLVGSAGSVKIDLVQPGIGTIGGPFSHDMVVPATIPDGAYRLIYTPSDYSPVTGGQFGVQNERHFVIDNTRPEVELLAPVANAVNPVNVQVKGTDNFALNKVTANIYDSTNTTLKKSCSATVTPDETDEYILTCPVSTYGLADGVYTIRYNASDMAGNISDTKTSKFRIDSTAPTITVKTGSSFTVGDAGQKVFSKVSFSLYDAGKIDKITLNGVEKDLNDNVWSDLNYVKPGIFGGVEGENILVVYDVAGNTTTYTFILDTIIPEFGLTAPTGTTNANSVEVKGWATDDNFRHYACYITTNQNITAFGENWAAGQEPKPKNGSGEYQSLTDQACNTSWSEAGSAGNPVTLGHFDISGLPDGTYTIHMHAHDLASNQNEATTEFTIDRTAPVVTVSSISDSTNTYPTITGTTSEKGGDVTIFIDGDEIITVTSDADGNWSYTPVVALSVGSHTVIAVATDAAGNTSSDDTSAPADYWTTFAVTVVTPPNPNTDGNNGAGSNGVSQILTNQFVTPGSTNANLSNANANNNDNATTDTTPATDDDTDVLAATDDNNTDSDDAGQVLAAQDTKGNWSVVNLVLAVVTIILSLAALLGLARKKDGKASRILTLIPVAIAVTAFLLIENLSASMIWLNWWTALYAVVLAVQVAIVSSLKNSREY